VAYARTHEAGAVAVRFNDPSAGSPTERFLRVPILQSAFRYRRTHVSLFDRSDSPSRAFPPVRLPPLRPGFPGDRLSLKPTPSPIISGTFRPSPLQSVNLPVVYRLGCGLSIVASDRLLPSTWALPTLLHPLSRAGRGTIGFRTSPQFERVAAPTRY